MIERYEQEMRKIFAEKQRISGFEQPAVKTAVSPEDVPAAPEFQQREQGNIEVPEREQLPSAPREEETAPQPEIVPDGIGHIIVEVTTARGAVPLAGVDVVMDRYDPSDPKGRQQLIAVETTNQSGRTKPVAVATVSRELSLVPGNGNPFSTFYVTASQSGFEPVKSRPVDVFSNEVSILKIDLIPKPENLAGGALPNG